MKEYQIQEAFCSKLRLLIISHLVTKKLLFTELKKLTNASDGNLSIQLKKLESWEYVKSEKKLMNGKAVTQYEITETGIQQFEEYVDFETFSKSDFRAVKVKACEAVKKSKKLLQFTLDDGTGTDRTILSGIHAYYEPEELVGKTLIAITNLPPRAMMGIDSCGMLLSAVHEEEGEEKLHLLMVDNHIPAGAKLY